MPKIPQSVMDFPGETREVLRQAAAWIEHHTLKIKHADTLARFHNKGDTIGVVDAFNKGLLGTMDHPWTRILIAPPETYDVAGLVR